VKRIAAVAALIVGMLAIPAAAAMASTNSPGPGSGYGQGQWGCQPSQFHHPYGSYHKHHRHHQFGFNNCAYPPPPPSGYCQGQSFTFSWVTGSGGIYEISGPALYTGEQFSYNGNIYTIVLANTTAGSMLVSSVNYGPTIFYGVGNLCSSYG
jgi:hypothetical protein